MSEAEERSERMVGWYVLALFLAVGSIVTAAGADTAPWVAVTAGLVTAAVVLTAVARSEPAGSDASSPQTVLAAVGAVVLLLVVRALDSGLALHVLVNIALGILVGALWRRSRLPRGGT